MKRLINKPLGQLLLEREVITKDQLEKALELQRQQGGAVGTDIGFIRVCR